MKSQVRILSPRLRSLRGGSGIVKHAHQNSETAKRRSVLRFFRLPQIQSLRGSVVRGFFCLGLSLAMPGNSRAQPLPFASPPSTFRAPVPALQEARQLILVRGRGWNEAAGATVTLFERTKAGDNWRQTAAASACTLGRNGLAWGIGLHGTCPTSGQPLLKREGDGRSPAGVS